MALEGQALETLTALARQMRAQEPDRALEEIERALAQNDCARAQRLCATERKRRQKPSLKLCLLAAQAALGVGDITQAAEEAHKALQLEPQNAEALKFLADLTFAAGEEQIALVYFQQALDNSLDWALLALPLSSLQTKTLKRRYQTQRAASGAAPENSPKSMTAPTSTNDTGDTVVAEATETADLAQPVDAPDLPSIEVCEEPPNDPAVEPTETQSLTLTRPPETSVSVTESEVTLEKTLESVPDEEPSTAPEESSAASSKSAETFGRYDRLTLHPMFQTETMAENLIAQGHKHSALRLLEQLAERGVSNSARARIDELRKSLSDSD